ncbi:hypothetical protein [Anaerocolumna xylanovorans]|uniref:Uncharacterized protein n=1 Tax=Anaerocolumna xylanovorans DSM 12503 TaxID=1121345 RepID=A0A1M7XYZ1_9FIRM|nr:hypothetical protein [Anaerocolumna xylanovorans]SHO44091.1 hypothetical protein SAMN02745217_00462 [Anaerocolumna xylanovorans DSM 12503]
MLNRFKAKTKYLIIIGILAFIAAMGTLVYAGAMAPSRPKINSRNISSDNKPIDSMVLLNNTYKSKGTLEQSPNGEITAKIVTKDGLKYDTVIFKGKDTIKALDLVDIFYTSIESTGWIDDTRYAICGHINPSLQIYVVLDASRNEIIGEYYGVGFTWNQKKDRLYYVETSPHFTAEKSSDKIMDSEGNIYYVSEPGISLSDKLAVSEDEKMFAFFVNDGSSELTRLYTGKLDNNQKIEIKSKTDAAIGDIKIKDEKSVEIENRVGKTSIYIQ